MVTEPGRVKLLQVITLSELGGAQKVVYHIAAGLEPERFAVTVACAPGGELVRWLEELPQGVKVVEMPALKRNPSPLNDLKAFWQLYRLMRREKYNIVHCHSSKAGILGRLAAYLAGVPKIYFTVHGWGVNRYQSLPVRFFYAWAERLAGAVSTKVICVSRRDFAKARSWKLTAADKLAVIYNGLPAAGALPGDLRRELGLSAGDILIGTVARLAPPKEVLFLLEVARRMADRPDVFFVLIGDGPLRTECMAFIKRHGLEKKVFLPGTREDAPGLLADLDIFVLFSRWEGLPLTVIEAMQAGLPVVASAVGGVGEQVAHGETGLLIEALDPAAAERALRELIADPARRKQMGERGRLRAAELFSLPEMVARYRQLYLGEC
ncbi:MAG: glycosyltransferase family 1 protein [Peptococcaceae bacterium]|nr:MAG: glycosyltransferase family 1 protein [Peptococcaceae bacterium]